MTFTFLIFCFPACGSCVQLSIFRNSLENDIAKNTAASAAGADFYLVLKGKSCFHSGRVQQNS